MALLDFGDAPHGGRVRLLPESATQERISPRLFIVHSMVGSIETARRTFETGNKESTFAVRLDGFVEQWMNTERLADANLNANPFAVSVETEDNGDPDTQKWTAAQLDTITWLAQECRRLHPAIALRRADRPDGAGIGFHTMWGSPSEWTPEVKTCPGLARVRQFDETLLPRILEGDMPLNSEDLKAVRKIVNEEVDKLYRLLARGEIGGQRSEPHFLDSTRHTRELIQDLKP
jgi:hypothetical protein